MAGDPIVTVRQQLVAALRPLMPTITDGTRQVPVSYSWPGSAQEREHVWTDDGDSPMSVPTMKSGRQRREVTTTFEVIVEVLMVGRAIDADGDTSLQIAADTQRERIVTLISEWIADNPLIGFDTRVIDWALLSRVQRAGGPTDNGVGSRAVLEVTYQARLL